MEHTQILESKSHLNVGESGQSWMNLDHSCLRFGLWPPLRHSVIQIHPLVVYWVINWPSGSVDYLNAGGFFWALTKKLKAKKTQTQGKWSENSRIFYPKNSRNRKFLGTFGTKSVFLTQKLIFKPKNLEISQKLDHFFKTQGLIYPKTQGIGKSICHCCPKNAKKNPWCNAYQNCDG